LSEIPQAEDGIWSYQSGQQSKQMDEQKGELGFEYTFTGPTYMIGYPRVVLNMSASESEDMDVFVCLRKADAHDKILCTINIPQEDLGMTEKVPLVNPLVFISPTGILRTNYRKIDKSKSSSHLPHHPHNETQLLKPGHIAELERGIWPTGMVFEAGEKLRLLIPSHHVVSAEFEPL